MGLGLWTCVGRRKECEKLKCSALDTEQLPQVASLKDPHRGRSPSSAAYVGRSRGQQ